MGEDVIDVEREDGTPMTSLERTAYPRFTRAPSVKELREVYTPSPGDMAFVTTRACWPAQKVALEPRGTWRD